MQGWLWWALTRVPRLRGAPPRRLEDRAPRGGARPSPAAAPAAGRRPLGGPAEGLTRARRPPKGDGRGGRSRAAAFTR